MIALNRRFFCFGAAAVLIPPPIRTYHVMPKWLDVPSPVHGATLSLDDMVRIMNMLDSMDVPEPRFIVANADRLRMVLTVDGN